MSEQVDIKAGDIVTLKSGGPKMTVGAYEGSLVNCYWFDGSDVYHHEKIHFQSITKVT